VRGFKASPFAPTVCPVSTSRYLRRMKLLLDAKVAADAGLSVAGLESVLRLFEEQLARGLHPGAALTVRKAGHIVLEAYGGKADEESGRAVDEDTLFLIFSATKPLLAVAIHMLVERGKLSLDQPIADIWPGFAQRGKEKVTVRHVLCHRGGFPIGPAWLTWQSWRDRDQVVRAMEERTARWEPGTQIGYHPLNFGWVLGEVLQRVDGRSPGRFIAEELVSPLGLRNTWLGLPSEQHPRVARLKDAGANLDFIEDFNRPEVHATECGAATGITTANDLSRFYSMLVAGGRAGGQRLLQPSTIAEAVAPASESDHDLTMGVPVRWALGFGLARPISPFGERSDPRTFGHSGQGSSIGWGDPTRDLSVAYITNGVRESSSNLARMSRMADAILAAVPQNR
jgi:CubicO group peptidase (beta-lactamase class C family)